MKVGFLGLFRKRGPKIKVETLKKDSFSGWLKCSGCSEMIHVEELTERLNCCPKCNYHYRISLKERLQQITDLESAKEMFQEILPVDPIHFVDKEPYSEKLKKTQAKTGRDEAVWVGEARIEGEPVALAILDFQFMGGSMGSVVGEKITRIIEYATKNEIAVLIVSASGGARMHESVFSLMQMAKTSSALARHAKEGLPYISLLTNPTTGGVTASFASLGDIIIGEPGALVGFTGARVIEQTTKQKLPEGAQSAEFMLQKGMIDIIVPRAKLKETLSFFLKFLLPLREEKKEEYITTRIRKYLSLAVGSR